MLVSTREALSAVLSAILSEEFSVQTLSSSLFSSIRAISFPKVAQP